MRTLLQAAKENDLLLHTILNHIAYVNRASGSDSGFAHCSHDATPTSRKKQVRFVLKITYSTAVLGLFLTLAEFFQRFGPYGRWYDQLSENSLMVTSHFY